MKNIFHFLFIVLFTACSGTNVATNKVPKHETFTIYSSKIGEQRTINVWTPPNYNENSVALPVIYMADELLA
ncbi:hypothetical protein K5I29_03025 [Flavobacterium agricola]|uniref:Esterase n=1 Tax=Flavobacterium agricola TaxID=2870839 RepID=A0ABY6M092_9FLAO|nr:hypothetical protein [Flavobacterium agricola]UYW01904.1 hypothetical protein K5I29_03025 [Flavobacterium agricola]